LYNNNIDNDGAVQELIIIALREAKEHQQIREFCDPVQNFMIRFRVYGQDHLPQVENTTHSRMLQKYY
jgi:hypothetical protein